MKSSPSEAGPLTYRELLEAARDQQPTTCPACGDDSQLAPTFDDDIWTCDACGNKWDAAEARR